jgi:hypothetical protein
MAELPPPVPNARPAVPRNPYRKADALTASSIVGKTMRIWISTLPKLLAVAALVHVPRFAVSWYFETHEAGATTVRLGQAFQRLEYLVLPAFVGVFAVYFVFQRLRDEPADLGRSVTLGFRRIGAALGITAMFAVPQIALAFMGQQSAQELLAGRRGGAGADPDSLGLLLTVGALSVVCQFIFALVFQSAMPAAVVEKLGVFRALGRSARLTSGRRMTIFGSNFIFGFLTAVLITPLTVVAMMQSNLTTRLAVLSAVLWVVGSLQCVFPIVQYHELRRTKEGFGIDELAKAFD